MVDSLSGDVVEPLLRGRFGRPYLHLARCLSTQRLLDEEAPEGAVATAEEQTEGRGRLGRRWQALPGTSILCSIVLRPRIEIARLPELSLVAGRGCSEAIAAVTGLEPEIKFPNDVLFGGRKVAGVLAEAHEGRVVLGIGVNVNAAAVELPSDLETPVTSLSLETGGPVGRAGLLVTLLERLEIVYDAWLAGERVNPPGSRL